MLLPVQEGSVRIFGLDVARRAVDVRRHLGYVPQQLSIEPALSVRQNVAWSPGCSTSRVGNEPPAPTRPSQALVNRPALLVLDEPTVGLDPIGRASDWERARQMRAGRSASAS